MDVAIVGGGITGLAAAYRLEQMNRSVSITLYEKWDRPGGKLMTDRVGDLLIERGADSFLSRKPRGIGLCEELGITPRLIGRRPQFRQTFIQRHGALHPLPEGLSGFVPTDLDALTDHPLLSASGLARLQQEAVVPGRQDPGDESVADFMIRRLGREAYENIVEPLMSGIFAGDGSRLSVLATYPHLREIEREHGSLLAGLQTRSAGASKVTYPPFVSFDGGMSVLGDALIQALDRTEILTATPVRSIRPDQNTWLIEVAGKTKTFDYVLSTVPAQAASRLVGGFDPELAGLLGDFPYASTAVVHLAFDQAQAGRLPRGYGYVVPRAEGKEVLACTWSSQKWAGRAPDGCLLLRVFIGRYGGLDVVGLDDEKLIEMAVREIRETLGVVTPPVFERVYRWPAGMPQYNLGHLERIDQLKQRLQRHPGFFMAGALFDGVGIPNCIASGEAAAEAILDLDLRRSFIQD